MIKPLRKAIFPVAGLGTRFLPATKSMPKEMLTVVDKPLIQYAVEEANAAGIEELIFVTSRGKSAMEDHFDHAIELEQTLERRGKKTELELLRNMLPKAGSIAYVRQQEPAGLGHAVWCARNFIGDEAVAVLLPDDLVHGKVACLKQMADVYRETGGNVIGVMEVPHEHTSRYGIVKPGADKGKLLEVAGLVEKPSPDKAPSNLAVIGRYILQPEIFHLLAAQEPGAGGEIQLTDSMARMIGRMPFHGLRFDGTRYDCGDKAGFIAANVNLALDHPAIGAAVRETVADIARRLKL
ncbi:UDP-glucose pyrophosphorylase [Dongia mobilis]|uniref:UTP--glucose-1-phosphate uridylyltransferase n=1 Tax=Dongia mobilis TaxID=578943 RepID=A0A4R6WL13_9PROT|nr:UTP--glucose-1-phosphate uridylyltransferase GalU [Dongia mobilis]TDQ81385.1 UDP-glucose pyrophosphorylase [Dongia mobilis]